MELTVGKIEFEGKDNKIYKTPEPVIDYVKVKQERDELLGLVRSVEWISDPEDVESNFCPWCRNWIFRKLKKSHLPTCKAAKYFQNKQEIA